METTYANIERELLVSTYLLGRSFVAESDHKPLEMIAMKNLANAPPHLQRMLLELQRYNVASKSLMDVETTYANIERELLVSTYLLGRSFIAESDHKPLEMIAMKNLANAPPHLQRMLLELQRYNVTIKYQPGKEMQLANALSRCLARASTEIKLDMQVDYIAFTKPWIEKLKDSMQRDPILAMVYQLTQQGWPHQR